MTAKTFTTNLGTIHYWINTEAANTDHQLIFLPGLTADHRLFDRQIEYFEGKYPVFVWDAPGHASSWPFEMTFSLADKAKWLNQILQENGFANPIYYRAVDGRLCRADVFTAVSRYAERFRLD